MKKLMTVLLIGLVAASFSAFAEGQAEEMEGEADEQRVVGFSQVDHQNPWRLAETESIRRVAEERGYTLQFSNAQAVQANQIKAVRSFIAQGVDGILLAPKTSTGWAPVLREAKEAGIPVVLVDRNVEADPDLVVTFIGSDFVDQGERVARQMIEDLGEGPLNVAELQGQPGADPTVDRAEGFRNVVNEYSEIEIILSQTGEFNRQQGKQVMEAFLQAEGDNIDAVYAHNDDMAIGAIQAIEEQGLEPGEDIWIGSIDGVRDIFTELQDGDANVTVESPPLMGPYGFDALEAAWAGEELDDWIKIDDEKFTDEEVDQEVIESRLY